MKEKKAKQEREVRFDFMFSGAVICGASDCE